MRLYAVWRTVGTLRASLSVLGCSGLKLRTGAMTTAPNGAHGFVSRAIGCKDTGEQSCIRTVRSSA